MVSLQWGTAIGYDILAFDKSGKVAFIEVKTTASYPRRWVLQSKYAHPRVDKIPLERRFVCCVDISGKAREPSVYVFPASVVSTGLHYYFNDKFPKSASYHLSLDFRPQGKSKQQIKTVGQFIEDGKYLENFNIFELETIVK
jgi:Domain of unknown function (DUF3883)